VEGVALGGSRAQGTSHADSDWDIAVYYLGGFEPQSVRDLGWAGDLTELGGWGPLFDGGGKLTIDGRTVDIHYRDLAHIERIHDDASRGQFTIEPLLFHQAGIPSYILLAELGLNRTLRGDLPRWDYPHQLRRRAPEVWWGRARMTLVYAEEGHARHGRLAQTAGLLSEAACHAAHAILAHRGEWVTNEKQLLTRAGLRSLDEAIADLAAEDLVATAARARDLITATVRAEGI
jgi:predicted nucleotidyltransferase